MVESEALFDIVASEPEVAVTWETSDLLPCVRRQSGHQVIECLSAGDVLHATRIQDDGVFGFLRVVDVSDGLLLGVINVEQLHAIIERVVDSLGVFTVRFLDAGGLLVGQVGVPVGDVLGVVVGHLGEAGRGGGGAFRVECLPVLSFVPTVSDQMSVTTTRIARHPLSVATQTIQILVSWRSNHLSLSGHWVSPWLMTLESWSRSVREPWSWKSNTSSSAKMRVRAVLNVTFCFDGLSD